jgi:hypothetical protein
MTIPLGIQKLLGGGKSTLMHRSDGDDISLLSFPHDKDSRLERTMKNIMISDAV